VVRVKKTLTILKAFLFVFAAIALMCLSSCGRGGQEYTGETTQTNGQTETKTPEPSPPDTAPSIITLTISTPDFFVSVLREAERLANQGYFGQQGQELKLEITDYKLDGTEWESHLARFNTLFMAGSGYDLFVIESHPLWKYSYTGMLTDIYTLIDRCSVVNRDDFYTNVLEAFEYQGKLLSMPLNFGFTFLGINSTLPQPIIDRYLQHETISYMEIYALYNDLKTLYPDEYDHMNISNAMLINWTSVFYTINERIDINARTVNLVNPQFINFLENFRPAENNIWLRPVPLRQGIPLLSKTNTEENVNYIVFNALRESLNPWEALVELENPPFLNYIPLTDSLGRFAINNFSNVNVNGSRAIAVNTGADKDAAWAFIRYLIGVIADSDNPLLQYNMGYHTGQHTLKTSILREGFEERARRGLNRVFEYAEISQIDLLPYVGQGTESNRERQIDNAVARLEKYNTMPVVQQPYLPFLPGQMTSIWDFVFGDAITAQDLARQWQNHLSLWLIE